MIKSQVLKEYKLSDSPGVYLFKQNKAILYVGKATSLKDRIKSYFREDLINVRGPLLVDMIFKATKIDFIKTDSVLEAIILEANLIKKYQPKYNTKEKSDKSFNYVVITKEDFSKIMIVRGGNIEQKDQEKAQLKYIFGPFPNSTQLREALKIIRKIFPFRDKCLPQSGESCFNRQLGLCPGVCDGSITKKEYSKTEKNVRLFFEGKKKQIIRNLNKDMKIFAKNGEYEKAGAIRNKVFALNHIQDVALIKEEHNRPGYQNNHPSLIKEGKGVVRIEAYDVAHLSGTNNVAVMVVMEDGEFKKADYRKFKIKGSSGNDIGALREILERRMKHTEWSKPDLIVVDGGIAQFNITKKVINQISIAAVTKNDKHKAKVIIGDEKSLKKYKKEILLINNEAHRSAIAFHRQGRGVIL